MDRAQPIKGEACSAKNLVHVDLDVDDRLQLGWGPQNKTCKIIEFACRPTLKALLGQYFWEYNFRLCYEASLCPGWRTQLQPPWGDLTINLALLPRQLKGLGGVLTESKLQIAALATGRRHQKPARDLTSYRGVKGFFDLTMITEISDIKRFCHLRQLAFWIGIGIREYSSGGKHEHLAITWQGNRNLHTACIEANQRSYRTTRISKDIKARRAR